MTAVQGQQPRFQTAGGIQARQLLQRVAARLRIGGIDRARTSSAARASPVAAKASKRSKALRPRSAESRSRPAPAVPAVRADAVRPARSTPLVGPDDARIAQGLAQHRQHRFPADGGLLGQHRETGDAVAPHPLIIVRPFGDRRLPNQAGIRAEREPPQFGRAGLILRFGRSPPATGEAQHRQQALGGGVVRLRFALEQAAYPASLALQRRFGFWRGLRWGLISGNFGETLRLAPEGFRLRAQAEHLGGGVAPCRGIAGQGVDHGVEQARPLRRLRPIAHVAGFLRLAWSSISSRPHCPRFFVAQPRFQHAGGGIADFGWPALRALSSKSGSSRARARAISRATITAKVSS